MEDRDARLPPIARNSRTPVTEAAAALSIVCDAYIESCSEWLVEQGIDPEKHFFENVFSKTWSDPNTDGDEEERSFFDDFDRDPEEMAKFAVLAAILITVSYVVQAMKARKNSGLAWSFAVSATRWAAVVNYAPYGKRRYGQAASDLAKKRHISTYAEREKVEEFWKEKIDPILSAQKAASKIELAGITELSHKKIAEIISALRRKEGVRKA